MILCYVKLRCFIELKIIKNFVTMKWALMILMFITYLTNTLSFIIGVKNNKNRKPSIYGLSIILNRF